MTLSGATEHSSLGGSLPSDLVHQVGRRVSAVALSMAGLWLLVSVLAELTTRVPGHDPRMATSWERFGPELAVLVIAVSLTLAWWARRDRSSSHVLTLSLSYEVFCSAAIAAITQWSPFVVGKGISWNCIGILVFPAIVPAPPRRILFVSLLAASAEPVAYLLAHRAGVAGPPQPAIQVFWTFLPAYLCAGLAVIPAGIVRRLGQAVRRAREMGSYRLGERLGAGGMGEVYEASHRLLARPAAVKLIAPAQLGARSMAGREVLAERFRREAAAAAGLRSPHTIQLYDFGEAADGSLYYAMELLEGIDLDTLVEEHGPLPPARAVHLLRQACRSLAEAHRLGLVHRDIKPANLMTCRMGTELDFVKVLDFGLVKVAPGQDPALTATDATAGTPTYMAPESIDGVAGVDHRADLYALGCVAYWLLSGRPPFTGGTAMAILLKHAHEPPPPLASARGPIPADLAAIVLRCLAKRPDERPADAEALERELAGCSVGQEWAPEAAKEWWTQWKPGTTPQ